MSEQWFRFFIDNDKLDTIKYNVCSIQTIMESDIQYYKAVIDTAQIISIWLKNNKQDVKKILSNLEISLEKKYGPFTSKLSDQLGINDTLGLKTPDSYWKGVRNTLDLIKNFINWKEMAQSPRTIENFLLEIVNKSNVRLEPDESPLVSALGISFDQEFLDSTPPAVDSYSSEPSQIASTFNETPESNVSFNEIQSSEPEPQIPEIQSLEDNFNQPSISEESVEQVNNEDAFNPDEFIDDEKFLDQFIADSTNPKESSTSSEDISDLGRDYLRSALEELTQSNSEELTESDSEESNDQTVDIKFAPVQPDNESSHNVILESEDAIDDALDEKQSSRLLSSSLRDALRMLREED